MQARIPSVLHPIFYITAFALLLALPAGPANAAAPAHTQSSATALGDITASPVLAESITRQLGDALRELLKNADLRDARKVFDKYVTTDHIRIALIVAGSLGLLLCFVGYHIWRWLLAILGMSIGLVSGAAGGFLLGDHWGRSIETSAIYAIAGGIVGFVILPLLMSLIVPLGTFILGTLLVGGLTYAICTHQAMELQNAAVTAGVVGGVAGLAIAILGRPGRIFFSSVIGAPLLTVSGLALAEIRGFSPGGLVDMGFNRDCSAFDYTVLGLMAGVAVLGIAFQFLTSSSPRKRQQQQPPLDVPGPSLDEQLARLRALRQRNLITEEDYQRKRNALLSQAQYAAQSQMTPRHPPQAPPPPRAS